LCSRPWLDARAASTTRGITATVNRFFAGERDARMVKYPGNLKGADDVAALMTREKIYIGRRWVLV
jgi:hypothetical protein